MGEWNLSSFFQQFFIIVAIIMQAYVAINIVLEESGAERFVRSTSIMAGILIFLGSKAFGITFADFMLLAILDASLYQVMLAGVVFPILIGILVAHITINTMSKGTNFMIRILLLVGVFVIMQIIYLNYYALTKVTLSAEKALLPNLCYSVSVMIWVIFNYKDSGSRTIRPRY